MLRQETRGTGPLCRDRRPMERVRCAGTGDLWDGPTVLGTGDPQDGHTVLGRRLRDGQASNELQGVNDSCTPLPKRGGPVTGPLSLYKVPL